MGRESRRVPLIRDRSSSSRALTPLSSTPSSRNRLSGAAAVVVDRVGVERCVENVDLESTL
jgi:hypothetical protein